MEVAALNSILGGSSLPSYDSIPTTIPTSYLVTDAMIQVTEPVLDSPGATHPPLSATELGIPPIPDSPPLICMNESKNEKGYDSDGDMGLFYDAVYDEATLLCDNKSDIVTELLEPAPDIPSLDTVLTHADIDKLKVVKLKEELKKRTCSIKVVRAELKLRLKEVV